MEEEVGIKVTRLRRRLSVEAEDVKSPSQSTPTKKRGGRLAAKPQLELIAENAPEAVPKRTRKSIAEPVEEKAVTPSRRSTRIRSNTSIVSETPDVAEDKGTPSRRSTRIKSNTSIIAETVQNVNSPRAKRAARRTSLAGSDNEAPVTPARQTRRTRKDSTSSVDKPVEPASKIDTQITDVIVEEAENNVKDSSLTEKSKTESIADKSKTESPIRKSPRLVGKARKSTSIDTENKEHELQNDKVTSQTTDVADKSISEPEAEQKNESKSKKTAEEINISITSKNLIDKLEEAPKKGKTDLNKTTTAIDEPQLKSTKRNRTKSWTTISVESTHENSFCSDSEATKKKNKNKNDSLNVSIITGSGDGMMNTSKGKENVMLNTSTLSNKKKKKRNEISMNAETDNSINDISVVNKSLNKSSTKLDAKEVSKDVDEGIDSLNSSQKLDSSNTQKFFEHAPSGTVQSLVFIDDSDSNHDSIGKESATSEDQLVPVVDHHLQKEETANVPESNLSYEPMDIDETMPENVSLSTFNDKNDSINIKESRKSILNNSQNPNVSLNKSKRKSVVSNIAEENSVDGGSKSQRNSMSEIINDDVKETNKSKRKSSISNIFSEDTTDSGSQDVNRKSLVVDMDTQDDSILNKSNKSKRKSSTSHNVTEDNADEDANKSARKSLNPEASNDESVNKGSNKSIRKSSVTDLVNDNLDKSLNKSKRKSSISNNVIENNADDDANKSIRKSLNPEASNDESVNKGSNKSLRKSSVTDLVNDDLDKSLNKSKRKSSVAAMDTENDAEEDSNETNNKSTRKSTILDLTNGEVDTSLNKSKRKSSVSAMVAEVSVNGPKTSLSDSCNDDDMINKNNNKSKRKSSIGNLANNDSMNKSSDKTKNKSLLDKSESAKSTLVLSQLKDMSENENLETSVPKDNNESSEQLSKSVNVPNVNAAKETDKKNLSLTYSTSTPLQQKSLKKLGLQINSSIIAPNSATKAEKKDTPNKSKKEISIMSQQKDESSEEEGTENESEEEGGSEDESEEEGGSEDESEEESSLKKSKMIDDEAEEASDDYESGDSRDEDEREYEKQNEIVEKGETLDSDDEDGYSDDSDYEKDSFVVTSDEEDNELLSGSGDDLSMSADELTMSAKSKKKFNERKLKEQKKASREMFEARHKLNESDKSAKSTKAKAKKNNRQRLDSSSSESDEEITAQPKKNRRQRIDSSQDISVKSDADKSMKKKVKRLSESVCDDNATNEKEITITEESQPGETDPLTLRDIVKVEPKTPQKELEISTVAVTDMDEMEKVNVDEDVSMIKSNQTSDPLQATTAQDDEEATDNDSISENEEITQNYESILNNLNKSNTKKIKNADISLDLNKKSKKKAKEPIVDELNLTQVKKSNKKKANSAENATENKKQNKSLTNKSIDKVAKEVDTFSEGSSDSIDMKLLFNEDSNDSELVMSKKKNTSLTAQKDDEKDVDKFIPLKRTEAKTNILEDTDVGNKSKNESLLNVSSKEKKNKRKSSFVEEISAMNDSNDAPLEVSYVSQKNKSRQDLNVTQNNEAGAEVVEANSSAKKKNKKNKKGLNSSQNVTDISIIDNEEKETEKPVDISISNVEGSAKKKKKKLSESQMDQETEITVPEEAKQNISLDSGKKKKQNSVPQVTEVEQNNDNEDNGDESSQEQITKKRKRKSSLNQTVEEIVIKDDVKLTQDESMTKKNQKKKRKISSNDEDNKPTGPVIETLMPVDNTKTKRKVVQQQEVNISDEGTKKNKKRKERDDDDSTKQSKWFSDMDLYITDSLQDMLDMDIKNEIATDLSSMTDFADTLGSHFSELPPLLDMDTDNSATWLNNSSSFVHNLDLYGSEANAVMVNPNSVMPSTFVETPVKNIVKEEASNLLLTSAANDDLSNNSISLPSPKEEKSHLTFSPNAIKVSKVQEPEKPKVKENSELEEATQMVIYVRKQEKNVVKDLIKDLDKSKVSSITTPTTVRIKSQSEIIKVNNKSCSILNTNQKVAHSLGTKTIISGNIHILDPQQINTRTILATILIDNSLNNNRQIIKTSVNGGFTLDTSHTKYVNASNKTSTSEFPKPAYSYSCLIAMALKNSRTGSLPVSEIYNFIQHFPYFKTAPNGWKNSVRHNLSLNKCFEKIEKPSTNGSQRKGCLWAMNPSK
ncbi:hypothetical protein SFRURICE_019399 [Spodoptera frugiperda]|nr:hypothetical protein SFRURICE_019399 [Spodoptera frugiperda]